MVVMSKRSDLMGAWLEHEAEAEAWERQHEAEWLGLDQKLRGIAARRAAMDAEEANLLRYAEELKLWRGFGCGPKRRDASRGPIGRASTASNSSWAWLSTRLGPPSER